MGLKAVAPQRRDRYDTLELQDVLGRNIVSRELCGWLCSPGLMNGQAGFHFLGAD